MYFATSVAYASGVLEAFILTVFFFIKMFTGTPMLIVSLVRLLHRIIGYVAIIISMWALLSGLYSYSSPVKKLMYIHWAGYFLAWLVLEIIHQIRYKNRKFGADFGLYKVKKVWTLEKFRQEVKKGKKYALFDDCVVNLTFYFHPGG